MSEMSTPRRTKPRNEVKIVYVGFRMEAWLRHALDEIARKEERTLTQIIRHAVKEYIDRHNKKSQAA